MPTTPVGAFDPKGAPTQLSYNVPQPASYSGKNYIELKLIPSGSKVEDYFKAALCKQVTPPDIGAAMKLDQAALATKVKTDLDLGLGASALFHAKASAARNFRIVKALPGATTAAALAATHAVVASKSDIGSEAVSADQVAALLKSGFKLNVFKSLFGAPKVNYIPAVPKIRPRIVLVESHRLSSYLGAYGVGKVLSTMSLIPGEKTKITVRSYTKESTTRAEASSVLDSFTQESSDDFESSLQSEQSRKDATSESFEYHAEAEAEASWGWGSAKVSGGVKGGTNSSREEFAKSASSALSKHAQKASAKRDVQINSSSSATSESGSEQEIVREIQNINVSRTLTFVFRQMNQEFITIHHLLDLRLAFFNGDGSQTREYTLSELDDLLNDVVLPAKQVEVKNAIVNEISGLVDYRGTKPSPLDIEGKPASGREFVEQVPRMDSNGVEVGTCQHV